MFVSFVFVTHAAPCSKHLLAQPLSLTAETFNGVKASGGSTAASPGKKQSQGSGVESFLLAPSRAFPMSHTTDCAYMFQVPQEPSLQLVDARPVKRSDVTGLYSDLCYRENV